MKETEGDEREGTKRAGWVHGVERIAAAFETDGPVEWRGQQAWLSFGGEAGERLDKAWSASTELWARGHLELALPVRIAVLFGPVADASEPGAGASAADVHELLSRAPEGAVVASEDVTFSLPRAARAAVAPLPGGLEGERAYAYPSDAARGSVESDGDDLGLWSDLEEYGQSPDVREIPYVGFRLPRRAPPRLDVLEVFTPPSVMFWDEVAGGPPSAMGIADGAMPTWGVPIEQALASHRHLVVLGEPGGGKTTLLRWLAVIAAAGWWPALTGEVGPRLPLLLSVGRLAEKLAEPRPAPVELLTRYFGVEDEPARATVAGFLDRQLERGRCAVLLDGFDEVRVEDRTRTEEWLSDFGARYPRNVFVSTSRYVGYSGLRVPGDARVATLSPLDEGARERFVQAFCRAYVKWEAGEDRPEAADAQAEALLEAIAASDRLASLAQNPFMLSALALIHRAEGRLPRHRVQAYEMFLRALCETWAEARRLVPADEARQDGATVAYEEQAVPVLGALALAMHEEHPRGVAPAEYVRDQIARALEAREEIDSQAALDAADAFLKRAGQQVQVLLERGPGQWGFSHLTFQEFFAAAGLHASERFEEVALSHLLEPRWEEILRLGVGYLALVQKRPVAAQRFVEKVLEWRAPEPWTRACEILGKHVGLAALLAVEAGDALPARTQRRIADAFAEWFCEGTPRELMELYPRPSAWSEGWLRQIALSELAGPIGEAFRGRLSAGTATGKVRAAFALGRLPAQLSTGEIVAAIEQGAHALGVASALGKAATDEELIALMEHPEERVRAAVIQALDEAPQGQQPTSARARVLATAAGDPSTWVRHLAAMAGQWRPGMSAPAPMSPEEEARLLPLLGDPSESVRLITLGRLGESERAEMVAAIERMAHEDPSEAVRQVALLSWIRRGGRKAFESALAEFSRHAGVQAWDVHRGNLAFWMNRDLATPILLSAAASADVGLRATAAFLLSSTLGRAPSDDEATRCRIEAAVTRLMSAPEPSVRRAALEGARQVTGDAMTLVRSISADVDASVRLAAYQLLGRSGSTASLAGGLDDESPGVRAFCLAALPTLPREEAAQRLAEAAGDESEAVREVAARFLSHSGPRTEALAQRFVSDPSAKVRRAAAETLANHELPVPVPEVAALLGEPDLGTRRAAAQALARAGDEGMVVLVSHSELPEARAALWIWAERRNWAFPAPSRPATEG